MLLIRLVFNYIYFAFLLFTSFDLEFRSNLVLNIISITSDASLGLYILCSLSNEMKYKIETFPINKDLMF